MLWTKPICLAAAALGCAISSAAPVSRIHFASGPRQTPLLELYTSEGCSSCPPAEAWLNRLRGSRRLWTQFVPAAFHVDYWDGAEWRDRWSNRLFTQRQQAYAQLWQSPMIYTPEFVLDGRDWQPWAVYKNGPPASLRNVGRLEIVSTNAALWQIRFAPARPNPAGYRYAAALLGNDLRSQVTGGENRGRQLVHSFVVLRLQRGPLERRGAWFQAEFHLDSNAAPEGDPLALAGWISSADSIVPLQAAGGWLTAPNSTVGR